MVASDIIIFIRYLSLVSRSLSSLRIKIPNYVALKIILILQKISYFIFSLGFHLRACVF